MSQPLARIMVVEDDETIALGLTAALRHAGYEVRRYDRAEIALDETEEWNPNLIILDRMLPGVDGLTALRYLRTTDPTIQVIMLTAKGAEGDRIEGLDAGADDFYAENNFYLVSTSVDQLMVIRDRLDNAGYVIKSAEIEMVPKTNQILDDLEANKFLKLLDALEDNDDVNKVYTNFDFD